MRVEVFGWDGVITSVVCTQDLFCLFVKRQRCPLLNIGDFRKLDAQLKPLLKPEVLNKRTWRKALNAFAARAVAALDPCVRWELEWL